MYRVPFVLGSVLSDDGDANKEEEISFLVEFTF